MATQSEIRRAIYWGDHYLDKLYHEVRYGGKTYGIIDSCAGLHFSLKVTSPLPGNALVDKRSVCLGPGYAIPSGFKECDPLTLLGLRWFETSRVLSGSRAVVDGRWKFDAVYELGFYLEKYSAEGSEYEWNPVAKIQVSYETHPSYSDRMLLKVKILDWLDPNINGDLYVTSEDVTKETPDIVDAKNHVGSVVERTTSPYGCFKRGYYWGEETALAAYYYWYCRPALRDRARKMFTFLDDYGYTVGDYRTTCLLGTSDSLPDNWLCDWGRNHSCDVWYNLPANPQVYPYMSSRCYCRGCIVGWQCGPYPEEAMRIPPLTSIYIRATHLLNKYGDPKYKEVMPVAGISGYFFGWCPSQCKGVVLPCTLPCPYAGRDVPPNSAEDFLLNGWRDACWDVTEPLQPPLIEDAKNIIDKKYDYYWHVGEKLIPFAILGYGFGYDEAKAIADALADLIVKTQWGYPFTNPGLGRIIIDGSPYEVNLPDLAGAFMYQWHYRDGVIYPGRPSGAGGGESGIPHQPGAIGNETAAGWTESQITTLMALRIYEAYKYRVTS